MTRLDETIDLFQSADPDTRLYLLLDYADRLPALPHDLEVLRDADMGRVHECQTRVFLYTRIEGEGEGRRVHIDADVPRESPTVRGLVSLLVESMQGASPAEVAAIPEDLLNQLGIAGQLGARRQQGFAGVLAALKRSVTSATTS